MDQEGRGRLGQMRQAPVNYVHTGMGVAAIGNGGPKEGQPDQEVACQFLRPEDGVVQYIAREDLCRHYGGHGEAQNKEGLFHQVVKLAAKLF